MQLPPGDRVLSAVRTCRLPSQLAETQRPRTRREFRSAHSSRCHSYHNQIVKDRTSRAAEATQTSLPSRQRPSSIPSKQHRHLLDQTRSQLAWQLLACRLAIRFPQLGPTPVGKSEYIEGLFLGKGVFGKSCRLSSEPISLNASLLSTSRATRQAAS